MSIKKRPLKSRGLSKVTFRLPKEVGQSAETAHIVGEFNDWDTSATPMKKLRSREFTVTIDLETGRAYQFRYLLDGSRWENDGEADKYVSAPFTNTENSVVVV